MIIRALITLIALIFFTTPLHALERPFFLDELEATGDMSVLSESQKEELRLYLLRLYLAEKSLQESDAHISITSLHATLDKASYTEGQTAHLIVSWDSLMAPEVLQYAKDIPTLSLTAYLLNTPKETDTPDTFVSHCSEEVSTIFPITDKHPTIDIPLSADCSDPRVVVTLFAPDGYALGLWTIAEPKVEERKEENSSAILVLGVLLAVGILGFVFTRFNNRGRIQNGS